MKLAITSEGETVQSPTDPRFGRAKFFIILDTEKQTSVAIPNTINLNAAQGAGIQAGKKIVESGADALITGHVGPKAYTTLHAGNIKIYTGATGTVADAVAQLQAGKLKAVGSPDVEGHW
jgi:predicted Fe-Mo cluster-binding NifX family protein